MIEKEEKGRGRAAHTISFKMKRILLRLIKLSKIKEDERD